ncbi:wax ester/triacylglycerol synthase domain-containing protein [Amycolatopsis rubida]|uniref:diacylglycerol O-acyltransferase n=1 Tax=Amycolatopsis rubida TaxID=112413 RepID=A0A1I5YH35_9PSEU|nr:wax ester/triacylglycerol synthase domain-containing protein [Amycolatopsis rubida]SFQ43531.1 acyltransferase, WS/DGAT/MGAT [Amycolatopsis rubida]
MTPAPLSSLDVAFLCLSRETAPMQMGAALVFAPERPVDPDRLTALLARRAANIPPLRRKIRAGLFPPGSATWVDDPDFRAVKHLRHHRLTTLYDPDPLPEFAARWIAEPLDPHRPLWELTVVTGFPDGSFAVLLKLHHALTDGAGAYAVTAGLLDGLPIPEPAPPIPQPRSPMSVVRDTVETAGIASSVVRAARPPCLPLAAPATAERRLGFARLASADLRRIRRTHGGTTNDVVLAVLSGALREWLVNRGIRATGRSLRALIPVSVRGRTAEQAGGNKLSGYLCDLPVGMDDPVRRLTEVRAAMTRNKAAGPSRGPGAFPLLADRMPAALHRLGTRTAGLAAPLLFDLVVTTVPVPRARHALDGAPLTQVYPFVPLAPRQAVGIAVAPCLDSVHIGLQANAGAVADLGSLRDAVAKSAAELLDCS